MNYVQNYYAGLEKLDEKCRNFFTKYEETEETEKSRKTLNKLEKKLSEERTKYTALLNKRYNQEFTPIEGITTITYYGRNDTEITFDAATGFLYSEDDNNDIEDENGNIKKQTVNNYQISVKTGEIDMVVGYAFNIASAIINTYHYHVKTDNSFIKLTLLKQTVVPIINQDKHNKHVYTTNINGENTLSENYDNLIWADKRRISSAFDAINAKQFLNIFYGVNRDMYEGVSISSVFAYSDINKAFETIVKTAPDELLKEMLLYQYDKNGSIPSLLEMSKDEYEYALNKHLIKEYLDFHKYLVSRYKDDYLKSHDLLKTHSQWIDFIEKCKAWEEDLLFYQIRYDGNLPNTLVQAYLGSSYSYTFKNMNKYYKFGKFCSYVIEGAINQGYASISSFCQELHDYIRMCEDLEVKPTLESSYLSQTHDITSRNHKIALNEKQEEIFKKKYKDFKPFKRETYTMIAPTSPNDVQKEGDMQNNCVASYIKRIIDGSCLIFFMRLTKNLDSSLVTVEVRDNAIVQAKQSHNNRITQEQRKFLEEFAKSRNMTVKASL